MKVLVILLIKFGDLNLKLKLLNLKRKWGTYKPAPQLPRCPQCSPFMPSPTVREMCFSEHSLKPFISSTLLKMEPLRPRNKI